VSQHGLRRVGGKFRAVKSCRGKLAEQPRKRLRGKRACFGEGPAAKLLGKQRSASDRSGAAAAKKTRFRNAPIFDASSKLKNVAANRIADFDANIRARKFAGVARILKMVENSVAKHRQKYGKPATPAQRGDRFGSVAQPILAVQSQLRHLLQASYFFDGKYFFSMPATTT
jgi:hypothetical protein